VDVARTIADTIDECLAKGMKPPVIVCVVSPNGSVLVVRFSETGAEPDVLAEHFEARGFALPMTVVVVDQNNMAARICLEETGRTWH
jgi:hypothetical protein